MAHNNTLSVAISRAEDAQHDLVLSFGTKGTIISGLSEADLLEIRSAIDCATSKGEDDAMNTKHTPGPWEMNVGQDGAVVYHPDQGTIADIPMDLSAHPHNARLVAAAPDLLEVLVEAEKIIADFDDRDELASEDVGVLKSIRAAIAKATVGTRHA